MGPIATDAEDQSRKQQFRTESGGGFTWSKVGDASSAPTPEAASSIRLQKRATKWKTAGWDAASFGFCRSSWQCFPQRADGGAASSSSHGPDMALVDIAGEPAV